MKLSIVCASKNMLIPASSSDVHEAQNLRRATTYRSASAYITQHCPLHARVCEPQRHVPAHSCANTHIYTHTHKNSTFSISFVSRLSWRTTASTASHPLNLMKHNLTHWGRLRSEDAHVRGPWLHLDTLFDFRVAMGAHVWVSSGNGENVKRRFKLKVKLMMKSWLMNKIIDRLQIKHNNMWL